MIACGRPPPLFPRKLNSVTRAWNRQIRLHARSLRGTRSPISLHAKLGLSLASFLSLVTVGCSLSQLNLDANRDSFVIPTQDNSRGQRQQTSEQTVFPGDHTGIARYDTARLDSTPNRVTDFAVGVLPVPSGYWSIFALISADADSDSESARPHGIALSWMRRNIVPAVAGSLADVHNDYPSRLSPLKADVDGALRQALARLDDDARTTTAARVVPGTTRKAGQIPSTLLAFFDSESRVLRIANTGTGRAFLGRRVTSSGGYESRELSGSGVGRARYFVNPDMHCNAFPSRGELNATPVGVESVEVRDGDFLVLGSHDTWSFLDGNEAVQAVSGWMREQEMARTQEQQPALRERQWPQDRAFDFPRRDNHGFGLGFDWVHTTVPDLIRDVDRMFVDARRNAASRILRLERKYSADGNSGNGQDLYASVGPGCSGPVSGSDQRKGGSVMVVLFTDRQSESSKQRRPTLD